MREPEGSPSFLPEPVERRSGAMTALERCHQLAKRLTDEGWNRKIYEELNETAYQNGICITEAFEDGFILVEDEMYPIEGC